MNQQILSILTQLSKQYQKDSTLKFKFIALQKAIKNIEKYDKQIASGTDAMTNVGNIGKGIADRIDEIIQTGTLEELGKVDAKLDAIADLNRITGIGDTRARELVEDGIDTINKYRAAVKSGKVTTTHHIDIGLKYFDDFETKIPAAEIQEMEVILRQTLGKINPKLKMEICGSYRRGRTMCGDIDVLFTNLDTGDKKFYLPKYVDALTSSGFIIDHLTTKGKKKYMGVCKVGSVARRIDIRFIDYEAFYAALIYFTGSKDFNIQIRRTALKKGYSLSEYGMKNSKTKEVVTHHSEKDIFEFLGMEYVDPLDRDI